MITVSLKDFSNFEIEAKCKKFSRSCNSVTLFQLEDIELVVADHVQGVVRTNFLASWDEISDDHEMQDTFALSSMESLEGKINF